MIDTILQSIFALAAVAWIVYMLNAILERLPEKPVFKFDGIRSKRVGIWGEIKEFWVNEFRIGYVDEWEVGYVIQIIAQADVEISGKEGERRVLFEIRGYRDAYKKTNIIGWGRETKEGERLEIFLSLAPDDVRDVLTELRAGNVGTIHVHGWQDEKSVKIEYFRFGPKM